MFVARRMRWLSPPESVAAARGERQVLEADVAQEAEPRADLLQNRLGDHLIPLGKREVLDEVERVDDRHVAQLADVLAADRHRKAFRRKALAVAGVARHGAHVRLDLLLDPRGGRVAEAALEVVDDALELRLVGAAAVLAPAAHRDLLALRAVQQNVDDLRRQLADRRIERKVVVLGERVHVHRGDRAALHRPAAALEAALADREPVIRDDQRRVDAHENAEARALRAGARGVVEREHARRKLFDADAVLRARVVLRKQDVLAVDDVDDHNAARKTRRRLERIGKARADVRLDDETVHDDLDVVLLVFLELDRLGKVVDQAVRTHADKAALAGRLKLLLVLALAPAHDRREHLDFRALRQREHLVDDLVDRLLADLPAADRAVRHADAGVQQTQIVVDLRDRAHGRARVLRGRLLVDRDRRGKPVDVVDVRLFHLAEEHARVARKRLDVPPLPLRVNRIEGERGLARAGKARQHDELVARQLHADVFEVVLPRPGHNDIL